jgi:hypothetical protein
MPNARSHRYLLGLGVGVALTFGLVWVYVLVFPMAFLEGGYALWSAKQSFVSSCDLGKAIILGDSRPEAAIDPRGLDIPTRNISLGGGSPLEAYFFVFRALRCSPAPRQVVLSFAMRDFTSVSEYLWEFGARFGVVDYGELNDISSTAQAIGDPSVENVNSRIGVGGKLRNLLYASQFPPLDFNALLASRLFGRYAMNEFILTKTRAALGHVRYVFDGTVLPPGAVPGAIPGDFNALPVQSAFFDRILALLQQRNIQAVFVSMPISGTVARQTKPAANKVFESYLLGLANRHPNFHIVMPLVVEWPEQTFKDGVHLEGSYAPLFTTRFKDCQNSMQKQTGPTFSCDLNWQDVALPAASRSLTLPASARIAEPR